MLLLDQKPNGSPDFLEGDEEDGDTSSPKAPFYKPLRKVQRSVAAKRLLKKNKPRTRQRSPPKNAFNAPLKLSAPLLALIGQCEQSRPQVTKQLWIYIKEHGLQDANDRRMINCDEKLRKVFKKLSVNMFEMNRLLVSHFFKKEDLAKGSRSDSNSDDDDDDDSKDAQSDESKKQVKEEKVA